MDPVRPPRKQPAAWPGNADHPLTTTHVGQHPVYLVSGQARHATASTRRLEATAAACQRAPSVVCTWAAREPCEAGSRVAARTEFLQLAPHERLEASISTRDPLCRTLASSLHCDHGATPCTNQANRVALVSWRLGARRGVSTPYGAAGGGQNNQSSPRSALMASEPRGCRLHR
ncbi:MAG: hypothetical protein ACJA00_005244 [Myxococcota bacterium]|jgi:hypothetical protein